MNIIIISGKIGSGKSSVLRDTKFLRKFSFPQEFLSADILGKNAYSSEISGYYFQKNPYLRRVSIRSERNICVQNAFTTEKQYIHKNKLRKYLFYSSEKNTYWNALEKILHPQISQRISQKISESQKKKGTLFIECALPQKLIFSQKNYSKNKNIREISLTAPRFFLLNLLAYRGLSPREISVFISRQKEV